MIPVHRDPAPLSLVPAGSIPSETTVWHVDAAMRWRIARWTLIAAALLHLLPLLFWLWHWGAQPGVAAPAIEVTLVPPPEEKPTAENPRLKPRESGSDQQTEARKSEKPAPAPPQPRSPDRPATKPAASGLAAPEAEPGPRLLAIRLPDKGGEAQRDRTGDAYLNRVMGMIERNRVYPDAALFGGAPSKVPIYSVGIEPSGAITTITLLASSGVNRVDEAGRAMIAATSPFPPLPPEYPQLRTVITIYIPVYPRGF